MSSPLWKISRKGYSSAECRYALREDASMETMSVSVESPGFAGMSETATVQNCVDKKLSITDII
jgi:hypothetical protein